MHSQPTPLRQRLREALTIAIKNRDRAAITALRSTLAAIENAEAVDTPPTTPGSLALEQSPVGAGAAEVERRPLTEKHVEEIVRTEIADRESAALTYDRLGQSEKAATLHTEAQTLSTHLP